MMTIPVLPETAILAQQALATDYFFKEKRLFSCSAQALVLVLPILSTFV